MTHRSISVAVPIIVAASALGIVLAATGTLAAGSCGNGKLEGGEQCDLGARNGQTNSGCTAKCKLASGKPACGDGILEKGEKCDLGKENGDTSPCDAYCRENGGQRGCTSTCQVAKGYHCGPNNSGCYKLCGDGYLEKGEKCDLGDGQNGVLKNGSNMGCTSDCKVQPGYMCKVGFVGKGFLDLCKNHDCCQYVPRCGNGVVDWPTEQCDHGAKNGKEGDTCSKTCEGQQ